ncbi:MAG TPA: hypothetical protein PLL26_07295 [Candidatus Dojkabacteria bacterium]|nr:hypothetical protein [Candidatus Dojkabacteria bacterium]
MINKTTLALIYLIFTCFFSSFGQNNFTMDYGRIYLKDDSLRNGFHMLKETDDKFYFVEIKSGINNALLQFDKDSNLVYLFVYLKDGMTISTFVENRDRVHAIGFNASFIADSSEISYNFIFDSSLAKTEKHVEIKNNDVYFTNVSLDTAKYFYTQDRKSKEDIIIVTKNSKGEILVKEWYKAKQEFNLIAEDKEQMLPIKKIYYEKGKIIRKSFFRDGELTKERYYKKPK